MTEDAALISEYCIALGLAIAGLYWLHEKHRSGKGKG